MDGGKLFISLFALLIYVLYKILKVEKYVSFNKNSWKDRD